MAPRNLSDFTRSEILNALTSRATGNHVERTLGLIEQDMADLKAAMLSLQAALEGVNHANSTAGS